MKKITLLALPLLLLGACTQKPTKDLKIVCPTGAPAFAFYNYSANENFQTNSTPSNIVAMMTKASDKTAVILPTDTGVKAIKNGAPYKIAANITFGNFFICSTGHDDNETMDPGDKIILFNQGATPDLLFHYIYGNEYDSGIEYVTAATDAKTCLDTSRNIVTGSDIDYVFLAQPAVFASLKTNTNAKVYANIQNLFKEKSEGKELVQASVFIKNNLEKEVADEFLSSLKSDIEAVLETPELITQKLGSLTDAEVQALYGTKAQVAMAVTKGGNGLGLGFKYAKDNKESIDNFLSVFSIEKTNEKIYY